MSEQYDKVKEIIIDKLGVDDGKITMEAKFIDDLGADSLDTVELIMQFEEEFDKLKASIISSLDKTREMYPNIDISCKIIPVSEGRLQVYRRRGHWGDRQSFPSNMLDSPVVRS